MSIEFFSRLFAYASFPALSCHDLKFVAIIPFRAGMLLDFMFGYIALHLGKMQV